MKECLIDVLNARNTVLQVVPIAVEHQDGTPNAVDAEHEALKLAASMRLVSEAEAEGLHARPHVSRGGQLTPYDVALQSLHGMVETTAHHVEVRAYFLWQHEGCLQDRADQHWHQARELESHKGSTSEA